MKYCLTLTICLIKIFSFSHQVHFSEFDQRLATSFDEMMRADLDDRLDQKALAFKNQLVEVLSLKDAIDYPFDSLGKRINIQVSKDQLFKTFSWDERTGGTWHNMAAVLQFRDSKGQVRTKLLDNDSDVELEGYPDVVYYEIFTLNIRNKAYYLLFGSGTFGSGHHHKTASLFTLDENRIKQVKCFGGEQDLIIQARRGDPIELSYNESNQTISHNYFQMGLMGFYESTTMKVTWTLNPGTVEFVKKVSR